MLFTKPIRILLLMLAVLLTAYFLFRGVALRYAFKHYQQKIQRTYGAKLNAAGFHFAGFDHMVVSGLYLQPLHADTLLTINSLDVNLSLVEMFIGKIAFDEITASDVKLNICAKSDSNNIRFLTHSGGASTSQTISSGYAKTANSLKNKFLRLLNTPLQVNSLQLLYRDSTRIENLYTPRFENNSEHITGLLINTLASDTFTLKGEVKNANKHYLFSVEHTANNNACLPFMNNEDGLKCRFQSLTAEIAFDNNNSALEITTSVNTTGFNIQHWRLSRENVHVEQGRLAGTIRIGDDFIELDSTSSISSGSLPVSLFARWHRSPDSLFTLRIKMDELPADTFFNSLPAGMFNTLKGISCSGTLAYDLYFKLNPNNPDSLEFNSTMKRKNLHINRYGEENYGRINNTFTHQVYDRDRLVRTIVVGPGNPMFTPLNQVSPYLTHSIMQSEDPSFMMHRGFISEAFRESIAQNYKERRFARGGSTITMQLVKNVFLNRNKTVSRKVEEALIVYLIENLGLVSKERMFEVYLNIIEWGPNVYGVGEAAHFYFNKKPSELNLQESIFLAAIIPNPKYFRYQFDKQGHLKPYLADYFRVLTNRMASKGWLTTADTTGLIPDVKLSGTARQLVVPVDSAANLDLQFFQ